MDFDESPVHEPLQRLSRWSANGLVADPGQFPQAVRGARAEPLENIEHDVK